MQQMVLPETLLIKMEMVLFLIILVVRILEKIRMQIHNIKYQEMFCQDLFIIHHHTILLMVLVSVENIYIIQWQSEVDICCIVTIVVNHTLGCIIFC